MPGTVLITGTSRGLGKEIANEFSKNGWGVITGFDVTDRKALKGIGHLVGSETESFRTNKIKGDSEGEKDFPPSAHGVPTVSREGRQQSAMRGKPWVSPIERLDVVINNAGINKDQLLVRTSLEDWERIIDVNLTGVFNICREAVRLMRKNGGHIINISSVAGIIGRQGQCAYSASKAGLIGFSKALAKEVARWNIKVNVILPGYMNTGMFTPPRYNIGAGQAHIERAKRENLLGRINEPSDIARFIYQLVHLDFISGQVFNLDSRVI